MRNDVLLERAAAGDESAWREILRRYSPLVLSVCRTCGLAKADADDVVGTVWLRLLKGVSSIREPEALPGWLATTTRRECLAMLRVNRRRIPRELEFLPETESAVDAFVLVAERFDVVRDVVPQLPQRDQDLLALLCADPPLPYAEISARLGVPRGAIGPMRQRCIARVRRFPAVAALVG